MGSFNPATETIIDYLRRKTKEVKNKRDLVRATGVEDWTISKLLNSDHSPSLKKIQPLFSYFIQEDLKANRRVRTKPAGKKTSIN